MAVPFYNPLSNTAIVRAPFDHFRMVWAALTLTTELFHRPVAIRVIHSAATLTNCRELIIKWNRALLRARTAGDSGAEDDEDTLNDAQGIDGLDQLVEDGEEDGVDAGDDADDTDV
ncbi:ribonuclease P/MRP protein subunit POP5 [Thecamonas trahens ATCC 50062]|uniref:Ribonuclease P/MRP protein subunit POP5 n=1 Tax=Thecamonas trahens ATCC 50062 TaxID=461836 RepID=A0A0L0D8C0_THETB|nr:ribonuclease P/MRP protein subunit POP5 [Thecamonas trahens ATCC 50062]KNC48326.1 ribonuclease P/MRP protein subunit POP5 [Thecamonas trahens ATCC 50062]|eukprot:XP_013758893.1 ribonuclease P/MRP protein subunit POP5 [Thecamonas trahens ATCC 50062]